MPRIKTRFKQFHIICLKPNELERFGFVKDSRGWRYKTDSGCHEIAVWNNKARHRQAYKMTFPFGTPKFTMEIAYLMTNLLKEEIIEFQLDTQDTLRQKKIAKLEEELRKGRLIRETIRRPND